jgi:hypothetical protein
LNRMSPITIIDHASIMTHREFPIFLLSSSSYHLQVMCGSSWAVAFVRLYRLFGSDCGTPRGWTTLAAGERGAPGYFILFFPACHLAGSAACRQLEGAGASVRHKEWRRTATPASGKLKFFEERIKARCLPINEKSDTKKQILTYK